MNSKNCLTPEYTAGLMDGEGCISIVRTRNHYRLMITLSQMFCPKVILALRETWGGGIHKTKEGLVRWTIYGSNAYVVLETIYPHLIVKKEQAKVAMDFQLEKWKMKKDRNMGVQVKLKEEISRLKRVEVI